MKTKKERIVFIIFVSLFVISQLLLHTQVNGQTGDYARVNGLELYYETHSAATQKGETPLILLHGGLGSSGMFYPILPELSETRKVIAVDLQGHGRTADIDRPLDVKLMADDIAALMDHLDMQQADLMGYSLGGSVALQTVIRHPGKVGKLVVVSAPFRHDAFYPGIRAQQAQMGPEAAEAMKETPMYENYTRVAPNPDDWTQLITKIGKAMDTEYDWSDDIQKIKKPMLIVAGDADLFPPSHAVDFFELLGGGQKDPGWDDSDRPASQLAILPNRTHYDIFNAPELAKTAVSFLGKNNSK